MERRTRIYCKKESHHYQNEIFPFSYFKTIFKLTGSKSFGSRNLVKILYM